MQCSKGTIGWSVTFTDSRANLPQNSDIVCRGGEKKGGGDREVREGRAGLQEIPA